MENLGFDAHGGDKRRLRLSRYGQPLLLAVEAVAFTCLNFTVFINLNRRGSAVEQIRAH